MEDPVHAREDLENFRPQQSVRIRDDAQAHWRRK
jgi:hypothetical protein